MAYYIDLSTISIDSYKTKLQSAYLPPSRMILKERLDERFDYFKSMGIKNAKELLYLLRKKDKLNELSKVECLAGDYLTILLRELNSTLPKPNKLSEFADIAAQTISKLEKIGIKDTAKLYEKVITASQRNQLAEATGISQSEILELTKLADLSRIKWVGVTFARMLFDLGVDTVYKASQENPEDLHKKINQINKERSIYKGQIGLNDIKIFVNAAKEMPLDIEY
jgi:hypothetical protein